MTKKVYEVIELLEANGWKYHKFKNSIACVENPDI